MMQLVNHEIPDHGIIRAEPEKKHYTLLIVDDQGGPCESLKFIFQNQYNILLASNGRDALDLARKHRITAVILDINMAGMNGIETLRKLKSIDQTMEVVMLTAYGCLDYAQQSLRRGASDFIEKPADLTTIESAVSKAVAKGIESRKAAQQQDIIRKFKMEIEEQKLQVETEKVRGDIYAGILHDIRNPMTAVSAILEILMEDIRKSPEGCTESVEKISRNLVKAGCQLKLSTDISNRHLRYLRLAPNDDTKSSVNDILKDLADILGDSPCLGSHQIEIQKLEEDISLNINGTELLIILLNLCHNAIQSTEKKHRVRITVERLMAPLPSKLFVEDRQQYFLNRDGIHPASLMVGIRVEDDGPGIPTMVFSQIFSSGFSTKTINNASGLGLSIVERLAKQNQTGLHVQSILGTGTTFTLFVSADL